MSKQDTAMQKAIAEMQYPTNYSRPFRLENKIVLMNDVLMAIDKY